MRSLHYKTSIRLCKGAGNGNVSWLVGRVLRRPDPMFACDYRHNVAGVVRRSGRCGRGKYWIASRDDGRTVRRFGTFVGAVRFASFDAGG